MKPLLYIFAFLILLAGCSGEQSGDNLIENATFTDLDGNDVSLSDFRGKVVLIDFWESWCGPCLQVFPAMQELREEYPDNFVVLAVTVGMMEGKAEAKEFVEKHDYDFQFLFDEYELFQKIGGHSIPYKIYIDPDGCLIKQELGSRGRFGDYNSAKNIILDYL